MIRRAFIAVIGLSLGCAGAVEPEPAQPEPARPAPAQPAPAPAPTTAPAPATAPAPTTAPAPAPVAEVLALLGGPGFWCAPRQSLEQRDTIVSECYRMEKTCESVRARREKSGLARGPCREMERAVCFVMADRGNHGIGFRCFESADQCAIERPFYIRDHQDPNKHRYTECEWTTRAELPERGRAVARAVRARH